MKGQNAGQLEPEVAWVLAAYGRLRNSESIRALGSAGGFSGSRFWRIELPPELFEPLSKSPGFSLPGHGNPPETEGYLCLQQWPEEIPSNAQLQFIHAVLRHVRRQGFSAIPTLCSTREGADFVEHAGHLWELRTWVPGEADFRRSASSAKLSAAMSALAGFHQAAATFYSGGPRRGVSPGISQRLIQLRDWVSGDATRLSAAIDARRWPEMAARGRSVLRLFGINAGAVLAQLEQAAQLEVSIQVCIRDIWHDHVLFEGDRVSGIIDFGAVGWDNVAMDIARLVGSLAADNREYWQEALAIYNRVRVLSESEFSLVQAFDRSTVLMSGMNWLDWVFRQRRKFENDWAILERMDHILARLGKL